MANAISTGMWGEGAMVGRAWPVELYWLHSPRHKTNSPSMTTHGEGWKTRCILFTPLPQLPSLLASLSVTELFIHCPALPFLSDTHYAHALFPSHTPTNPNMLYYRLGIYIAFRVKKQLRLSLGSGLHRSCAQAALYSCTVVRPLIHTELRIHSEQRTTTGQSWVITHHLYTWGKKLSCMLMNEQTAEWRFWVWRQQDICLG